MNGFKDSLFVGAVPAEPSVADDMVGRYETEMAGIYRLVGIIGPVSYTHLTLPTSDLV